MILGELSDTWLARILGGMVILPLTTPVVPLLLHGDSGWEISAAAVAPGSNGGECVRVGCGGDMDGGWARAGALPL